MAVACEGVAHEELMCQAPREYRPLWQRGAPRAEAVMGPPGPSAGQPQQRGAALGRSDDLEGGRVRFRKSVEIDLKY